jgi:hypothetical protein
MSKFARNASLKTLATFVCIVRPERGRSTVGRGVRTKNFEFESGLRAWQVSRLFGGLHERQYRPYYFFLSLDFALKDIDFALKDIDFALKSIIRLLKINIDRFLSIVHVFQRFEQLIRIIRAFCAKRDGIDS